jgi:hypothetical protein
MIIKSKKRVKKLGEVFTPHQLVEEILDRLPTKCWKHDQKIFEPSCGTGNFCVAILKRKLAAGHSPLDALGTIYGIDIMQDNVDECRARMADEAVGAGADRTDARAIVNRNIICGDALQADFSGDWPPRFSEGSKQKKVLQKERAPHGSSPATKPVKPVKLPKSPVPSVTTGFLSLLMPRLFVIADKHMPGVTINVKQRYTALSWQNRNVCFVYSGKSQIVFKLGIDEFHTLFESTGAHLTSGRDGKHTWPAVGISDETQLAECTDALSEAFTALAAKYSR